VDHAGKGRDGVGFGLSRTDCQNVDILEHRRGIPAKGLREDEAAAWYVSVWIYPRITAVIFSTFASYP
jgi:hypothetical protein